jgi:putative hemolysin
MNFGFELIVILLLTLVNGFFAAAEIGLLSVRRSRLQELAAEGRAAASAALRLRDNPEQFLATVQVGITVGGATAGAFGGATLEEPLARWFESLGMTRGSEQLALAVVVALISVLSIVLGELVPKSLALRASERVSLMIARPLLLLSRVAKPLVFLLTQLSNLVLRPFRDHTTFTEARLSPEELQNLVEEAATSGSLSPGTGDIASRAIELGQLPVSSLLIPRTEVTAIPRAASRDDVWLILKTRPHSRYPIVQNDLDSVEGYVVARDLVSQLVETGTVDLRAITREVPFILDRTQAVTALRELQAKQTKLAVVVDEHGMTAGIVTIGDIADALLGEALDEHEQPDSSIRFESPGIALVRGDVAVQDVNRALGTDLPISTHYATLAGLLMHESARIMRKGEHVQIDGADFEVVDATVRQVKQIRVHVQAAPTDEARAAKDE